MENYNNVEHWIKTHARPLENRLYDFFFNHGHSQEEVNELIKFQNEDGGFGSGLEPDSLNPNSSPIQTWWAIHILMDLPFEKTSKIHEKILNYLDKLYNQDPIFKTVIPSNNLFPHAKWWDYIEKEDVWGFNPSIALWAYMFKQNPNHASKTNIENAFKEFINTPKTEMHELKCFIDAFEWLVELKHHFKDFLTFEKVLKQTIKESLKDYDPNKEVYQITPLSLCDHKQTVLYPLLKPTIERELDYLKDIIKEVSIWPIHFHWGQYEDEYKNAKTAWMGIQAVKILRFLKGDMNRY